MTLLAPAAACACAGGRWRWMRALPRDRSAGRVRGTARSRTADRSRATDDTLAHRGGCAAPRRPRPTTDRGAVRDAPAPPATRRDLRPAALDRVVRVATWVFLFAVTTIVAVTDLWGASEGPILALLVVGGPVHVRPPRARPAARPGLAPADRRGRARRAVRERAARPHRRRRQPVLVRPAADRRRGGDRRDAGHRPRADRRRRARVPRRGPRAARPGSTGRGSRRSRVNLTALCLVAYVGHGDRARAAAGARGREPPGDRRPADGPAHAAVPVRRPGARARAQPAHRPRLLPPDDRPRRPQGRSTTGHGHLAGDRALRLVGDVVRAGIRRIDTGARFGGDEFVVLLPETDPTGGWVLAEKIRQGVAEAGPRPSTACTSRRASRSASSRYPQDGESAGRAARARRRGDVPLEARRPRPDDRACRSWTPSRTRPATALRPRAPRREVAASRCSIGR